MNPEETTSTTPKITPLKVAAGAAKFAVKHCVSATVTSIIYKNVVIESKKDKIQIAIGAYLLTTMVADLAWDHTADEVVRKAQYFKQVTKQLEEKNEDIETL